MDRRHVVEAALAGFVCLGTPLSSWPRVNEALLAPNLGRVANRPKSVKVIGVGGAGCNFIDSLRSSLDLHRLTNVSELVCVDLGTRNLPLVETDNDWATYALPVRSISLGNFGSGGRVNVARAAAMRNIDALNAAVNGAGTVILVAGLGGGTGSGVTSIVARLARNAGAVTIAAIVMPFDFEGPRNVTAETALSHLERDVDLAMPFSNQDLGDSMGDGVQLADIYAQQDRRIIAWLATSKGLDAAKVVSGHSLRADFVPESAAQGLQTSAIMGHYWSQVD